MKPAQNVHFSPRNPEVRPQILSTREKKKEKQNEKGRNIFLKGKQKDIKGIKNEERENT